MLFCVRAFKPPPIPPSGFFGTITSIFIDGIQNDLAQMFPYSVDVLFEGFLWVDQRSKSLALDELSLHNLLVFRNVLAKGIRSKFFFSVTVNINFISWHEGLVRYVTSRGGRYLAILTKICHVKFRIQKICRVQKGQMRKVP